MNKQIFEMKKKEKQRSAYVSGEGQASKRKILRMSFEKYSNKMENGKPSKARIPCSLLCIFRF
jgi:predicted RNA-binding protein YlxR (DUF448 family)